MSHFRSDLSLRHDTLWTVTSTSPNTASMNRTGAVVNPRTSKSLLRQCVSLQSPPVRTDIRKLSFLSAESAQAASDNNVNMFCMPEDDVLNITACHYLQSLLRSFIWMCFHSWCHWDIRPAFPGEGTHNLTLISIRLKIFFFTTNVHVRRMYKIWRINLKVQCLLAESEYTEVYNCYEIKKNIYIFVAILLL